MPTPSATPEAASSVASVSSPAPAPAPWYFASFENRRPPTAVAHSEGRQQLFQALATAALVFGFSYLAWRWTSSLNWSVWWFAIPLAAAETAAFVGTIMFFLSIWRNRDVERAAAPATVNDILEHQLDVDRPLIVDVFFATYNEDVELVRLSLRDAKAMHYPHDIDVRIHALDDGRRPAMRRVAEEEGVGYISRTNNVGFKAGNMRNAIEQTQGDLLVICDADTRPFPELLAHTLGYFRDHTVAWVQTPQWFYDLDEGTRLGEVLGARVGAIGRLFARGVEAVVGPISLGADPLGNDPGLFYDVIQRRRNWCNASFCCGAGSIHRREAILEAALKSYGAQIEHAVQPFVQPITDDVIRHDLSEEISREVARDIEFTPYKFHVSEDIYTSIVLHSDAERHWRSVYHPEVLSKMLSPQDLLAWTVQRFKYAGGTLDIFRNDTVLRLPGLSSWQKFMYGATIYSYFAPLWTVVFMVAPILAMCTGLSPLAAYSSDFYWHLLPFLVVNKLAFMVGTWGVSSWRGEQYYLSFFWINLKALLEVARRRPIKFHVTPKTRSAERFVILVWPHLAIIGLTIAAAIFRAVAIGVFEHGDPSAFVANLFWGAANILSLLVIVQAALKKPQPE